MAGSLAVAVPVSMTTAQPAGISAKRAEVARLEAQLAAIDDKAAQAAEQYNGARWEQQQIEGRIVTNVRRTTETAKRLKKSQGVLADRLRSMYANPEPSLVEVLASSGSVVAAMDGQELMERVGERDGTVVRGIRHDLDQLHVVRKQLDRDRADQKVKVAEAADRKRQIEGLLAERRRVVEGARGELRQMIAAEEARKRREAERQKQAALAAQRAAAAREAAVRSTPPSAPSSPASPAAPSSPSSAPSAGPAGSTGQKAVSLAMGYLGVPYVWGGASPSGFDCSGLMSYVYGQLGINVPHYTGAIWAAFPKVSQGDLQPGDMVFFYSDLHHMGMYIGNGQFIHAPHTGDVVKITPLSERAGVYAGAVRPY